MRPLWTGALTFGLVNIPVRLAFGGASEGARELSPAAQEDLSPIRYERVCQKEGEAVDWKDIVKGYEYTKGKFVVLTDDDFKAAAIESSKTIEILDFVGAGRDRSTLLRDAVLPRSRQRAAKKPMRCFARRSRTREPSASAKSRCARTRFTSRASSRSATPLVLEIMRFADELVDRRRRSVFPSDAGVQTARAANGGAAGRQPVDDVRSEQIHRRLSRESHEDHSRQDEGKKDRDRRTGGARKHPGRRSHHSAAGKPRNGKEARRCA